MLVKKNILELIVNVIKRIINIDDFRVKVQQFIDKQYNKGLEASGIEFNMNFVPEGKDVTFLNKYVFENLKQHTDEIGQDLRKTLSRAVLDKQDAGSLKKLVKETFKDKKYSNRLKMVLRTEGMRANNYGALEGAEQSGLDLKKYIDIVNDSRTTDVSFAMFDKYGSAEKAIPLDKEFKVRVHGKTYSGQAPPFMPNDRDVVRFTKE